MLAESPIETAEGRVPAATSKASSKAASMRDDKHKACQGPPPELLAQPKTAPSDLTPPPPHPAPSPQPAQPVSQPTPPERREVEVFPNSYYQLPATAAGSPGHQSPPPLVPTSPAADDDSAAEATSPTQEPGDPPEPDLTPPPPYPAPSPQPAQPVSQPTPPKRREVEVFPNSYYQLPATAAGSGPSQCQPTAFNSAAFKFVPPFEESSSAVFKFVPPFEESSSAPAPNITPTPLHPAPWDAGESAPEGPQPAQPVSQPTPPAAAPPLDVQHHSSAQPCSSQDIQLNQEFAGIVTKRERDKMSDSSNAQGRVHPDAASIRLPPPQTQSSSFTVEPSSSASSGPLQSRCSARDIRLDEGSIGKGPDSSDAGGMRIFPKARGSVARGSPKPPAASPPLHLRRGSTAPRDAGESAPEGPPAKHARHSWSDHDEDVQVQEAELWPTPAGKHLQAWSVHSAMYPESTDLIGLWSHMP